MQYQQERATLTINDVVMCEDSSPLAIAEAYRHHARETAQISTEIKGIDDAIAAMIAELQTHSSAVKAFFSRTATIKARTVRVS
jgi:hypothetical protein